MITDDGKAIKKAWENLIETLPQWAKDKANLFLLADQELVIHQAKGIPVHIKKVGVLIVENAVLQRLKNILLLAAMMNLNAMHWKKLAINGSVLLVLTGHSGVLCRVQIKLRTQ